MPTDKQRERDFRGGEPREIDQLLKGKRNYIETVFSNIIWTLKIAAGQD